MMLPPQPQPQPIPFHYKITVLLFGIVLLACGLYLKRSYESKDLLRTKTEKTKIDKITRYDVVYRSLAETDYVYNVPPQSVKRVYDIHFFRKKRGSTMQSLPFPITSVTKTVSQIEVSLADGKKVLMDENNFTTDITEGSVGKEIDIEYDSNDLSNVSMVVDGLNSRQFRSSWSLIIGGIVFIVIYILMFFGVI